MTRTEHGRDLEDRALVEDQIENAPRAIDLSAIARNDRKQGLFAAVDRIVTFDARGHFID